MLGDGITDYRIVQMLPIPTARNLIPILANRDVSISFKTRTSGNPEFVQIWRTRHDIRAGDT